MPNETPPDGTTEGLGNATTNESSTQIPVTDGSENLYPDRIEDPEKARAMAEAADPRMENALYWKNEKTEAQENADQLKEVLDTQSYDGDEKVFGKALKKVHPDRGYAPTWGNVQSVESKQREIAESSAAREAQARAWADEDAEKAGDIWDIAYGESGAEEKRIHNIDKARVMAEAADFWMSVAVRENKPELKEWAAQHAYDAGKLFDQAGNLRAYRKLVEKKEAVEEERRRLSAGRKY
ncbi:MAG TPA: hypothetical protein VEH48_02845 [Candidatus Nitrosopolaris sp.]|nr:hypothetical protein [Candidatus Nitrosopolaris sp.]